MVGISFYEALAYCRWLCEKNTEYVFRLPNELQWDYAAHGDEIVFQLKHIRKNIFQSRVWYTNTIEAITNLIKRLIGKEEKGSPEQNSSDRIQELVSRLIEYLDKYADEYKEQLEYNKLTPVGVFKPYKIGCYDFYGNVWQWCDTWLPITYPVTDKIPSQTQEKINEPVIVKGGAWVGSNNHIWLLIGGWFDPYARFQKIGFRICVTKAKNM